MGGNGKIQYVYVLITIKCTVKIFLAGHGGTWPLIPAHTASIGKWLSESSRSAWSAQRIPGESGLQSEILSSKTNDLS